MANPATSVLQQPLTALPAVTHARAKLLTKINLNTIKDLLWYFPRAYQDRSQPGSFGSLKPGEKVAVVGEVCDIRSRRPRSGRVKNVLEVLFTDGTHELKAVWFNQGFLVKRFVPNTKWLLYGEVLLDHGGMTMRSPEYESWCPENDDPSIVPIYPLTQGLNQTFLRHAVREALNHVGGPQGYPDPIPLNIRSKHQLLGLGTAVAQMHFPPVLSEPPHPPPEVEQELLPLTNQWINYIESSPRTGDLKPDELPQLESARRRLVFDELFGMQLALGLIRARNQKPTRTDQHDKTIAKLKLVSQLGEQLPFELTNAQRKAIKTILKDILEPTPMQCLLQGDVGSGKTVVILFAMLGAIELGYQSALLAPTQILAQQHYDTIARFLGDAGLLYNEADPDKHGLRIAIRTAAHQPHGDLAWWDSDESNADIIIGTHALLEEKVKFRRLGLAIIDEQHKFGVAQRATLVSKGDHPDLLVTTATPIPRSLALTLYGDLDLVLLDELPPGRGTIETRWVTDQDKREVFDTICKAVNAGTQVYVIAPLVEESDHLEEVRSVTQVAEKWGRYFENHQWVSALHGRMPPDQKTEIVERWRAGDIRILVSTTVVEVGVDVPNASMMLVLNAERFGLSQLHQLRGRIGRGSKQSVCYLLSKPEPGETAKRRIHAMVETNDGFVVAETDLLLRGPGELAGTIQSGHKLFHLAELPRDTSILAIARREAEAMLAHDPTLASEPELARLAYQQDLYRWLTAA